MFNDLIILVEEYNFIYCVNLVNWVIFIILVNFIKRMKFWIKVGINDCFFNCILWCRLWFFIWLEIVFDVSFLFNWVMYIKELNIYKYVF